MKEKMMKNQIKREECRNWFCSHIVVIAVVCFALGLFLSSCHFAKASEAVHDDIKTYLNSMALDSDASYYVNNVMNLTDYDYYYEIKFNNGTYDLIILNLCHTPDFFVNYVSSDDSASYQGFQYLRENVGYLRIYISTAPGHPVVQFAQWNASSFINQSYYYITYNSLNYWLMQYTFTSLFVDSEWSNPNQSTASKQYMDFDTVYSNGVYPYIFTSTSPVYMPNTTIDYGYTEIGHFFDSYSSDSRLKFATWSDSLGRSILHVDMTDYLNSTGFNISNTTLNNFTLSIDYSIQNSDSSETHNISFNNSSIYFKEYGENGKLTKVYMNIPYTEFYGFSYEENSFPDYDDVVIQNAIVNLDLVPVGGDTSINITSYVDCLYYLQHVYDDIVPEVLPLPEYDDTFVQDAQQLINSINQLYAGSSFYTDGDFTFSSPITLPDWADIWEYDLTYGTIGSDNEYLGNFYPYPYDVNGNNQRQDVNDIIYDFADDKYAYYDVVRLRVFRARINSDIDVSVTYLDTVYIYLYTERYFLRKDALTNIDILKMLQQSASNDVTFFESIRERVDDFEKKTLLAITGDENSIFGYINILDSDINSGVQRIIDSMPVFNWSPFNDDDILNALYTIVANQDNPKDGYARYIAWVKSESNSDNGFKLWANDMFDVFHDIYNFFNYQDDIDPNTPGLQKYIVYVQQYIKYLTQDTNDIDSSQYVYYKGIFDNTYNIHNVDGRSG